MRILGRQPLWFIVNTVFTVNCEYKHAFRDSLPGLHIKKDERFTLFPLQYVCPYLLFPVFIRTSELKSFTKREL